jgi:hypothetical protein
MKSTLTFMPLKIVKNYSVINILNTSCKMRHSGLKIRIQSLGEMLNKDPYTMKTDLHLHSCLNPVRHTVLYRYEVPV